MKVRTDCLIQVPVELESDTTEEEKRLEWVFQQTSSHSLLWRRDMLRQSSECSPPRRIAYT